MGSKVWLPIVTGVSGLLIGGGIGYFVARKLVLDEVENRIQEEVAEVKEHYRLLHKVNIEPADLVRERKEREARTQSENKDELQKHREAVEEIVKKNGYQTVNLDREAEKEDVSEEVEEIPEEDKQPIEEAKDDLHKEDDDAELERLISLRNPDEPYLITIEEFMSDDRDDLDKISLTWFDGDDTLIDDSERVIVEVDRTVGLENLTRFGFFSQDKNIVYVRNERMGSDFEVVLDEREFIDILANVKHYKPPMRKMREDD